MFNSGIFLPLFHQEGVLNFFYCCQSDKRTQSSQSVFSVTFLWWLMLSTVYAAQDSAVVLFLWTAVRILLLFVGVWLLFFSDVLEGAWYTQKITLLSGLEVTNVLPPQLVLCFDAAAGDFQSLEFTVASFTVHLRAWVHTGPWTWGTLSLFFYLGNFHLFL